MHTPVLLNEAIKFLELKNCEIVLDATVDGGGHAMEILERILPDGVLIGIDQDKQLLDELNSKFKARNPKLKKNLILINGNFGDLDKLLKLIGIESIDAALFDLGMSSEQLDESGRGFSFLKDEPLLMNYKFPPEPEDLTAREILNNFQEGEIARILKEYGEERFDGRIARRVVERRRQCPFKMTGDLVKVIGEAVPAFYKRRRLHFATRTFQALRIAVNDELEVLKEGLLKSFKFLKPRGRLIVISFHSLEDRIVKNFLRERAKAGEVEILTKKPVTASREEILKNPRSRSAKLRAIKKI